MKLKVAILLAAFAIGGPAAAQTSQQACNDIGTLGKSLAAERDRGVSLQQQLQRNEATMAASRDESSLKPLLESITRSVHGDMKKVTPEDTYWRLRTLCLTRK
jgi:hypothetical protein